jgi:hypothetical protein
LRQELKGYNSQMTCTQKSMYESWQMDNLLIMIFQNDILYDL